MKRKTVKNKYRKLNNQGLTLVELLVAMAILAVIVVPLLHAFISSMQVNAKARNSLRGTTVAQDIVEGIKAYDVDELTYQFNFPDKDFRVIDLKTVSGASVQEIRITGSVSDAAIPYTSVDAAKTKTETGHAGVFSGDGGTTHEFIGQDDGKYYFAMKSIPFHNKKYDALIELDATPYRAGGVVSANDVEVISVSKMNTNFDAFYVQEPQQDENTFAELNLSGHSILKTAIDREITIDVTKTPRIGKTDLTKVTCNYVYTGTDTSPIMGTNTVTKENVIFSNSETDKDLVNIYLFYYPLYHWKTDTIVINNLENLPINFYVVKQYASSGTATMLADELNYRMNLKIKENGGSAATANTKLFTNLNTNLSDKTSVNQATITFNGMGTTLADLQAGNLTGSEKRDRLYKVNVFVYNEGAAVNDFPSADRLMTISGSKED